MTYQSLTRTLTNTAVAVDSFISLTAQGSSSNLSSNIPSGSSSLVKVDIAVSGDVTPKVTMVKLSGSQFEEQVLTGPCNGGASSGQVQNFLSIPCNFTVKENASFDIQFAQMSAGSETLTVSVTCYFQ